MWPTGHRFTIPGLYCVCRDVFQASNMTYVQVRWVPDGKSFQTLMRLKPTMEKNIGEKGGRTESKDPFLQRLMCIQAPHHHLQQTASSLIGDLCLPAAAHHLSLTTKCVHQMGKTFFCPGCLFIFTFKVTARQIWSRDPHFKQFSCKIKHRCTSKEEENARLWRLQQCTPIHLKVG